MKKLFHHLVHKAGYTIKRNRVLSDQEVYFSFYGDDSIRQKRFYNFGAGAFDHPCWTSVDRSFDNTSGTTPMGNRLVYDLHSLKPVPVESQSAEIVYSSHLLGHVTQEAAVHMIQESYRILRKGGVLRIVVADFDRMFKAWKEDDIHFFYWRAESRFNEGYRQYGLKIPLMQASITQLLIEEFASSASELMEVGASVRMTDEEFREAVHHSSVEKAMDRCTSLCPVHLQEQYPFRHMNWFNEKKLSGMLESAGFLNPHRSAYLQSGAHVLRNGNYFDSTTPQLSLYMEARK